jgi:zinc transport system substrate-binding protein
MRKVLFFMALLFLFACGNKQKQKDNKAGESTRLVVASVNYPLYYFAQQIGGDLIQTEYPVPADVDPAYWVPDEKALEVYQSADVILTNGADYAKWMNNVSLSASRIVNTSKAVEKSYIEVTEGATHSHGPGGEHEHTGYAFTTWHNFELAAQQAEQIKEVLVSKRPENKEAFEKNFKVLQDALEAINKQMIQIGVELNEQHIIGSHPVYQYLAQAYGLKIHSVHFEPGEIPTKDQWIEFDHLIDHNPSQIMLWEDWPLEEVGKLLNEKGIQVIVFNPCGNKPIGGDFIKKMNENITSLQNAL